MKRAMQLLAGLLVLVLPLSTMADTGSGGTTFTNTTSTSRWNAYGQYVSVTPYVGPVAITVGDLGECNLTLPYSCNPSSGTGTQADPYSCTTPPALINCGSGTPWVIAAGGVDYDTRTDNFVPTAAPITDAAPVPLSPWLPVGSALGAMLVVLWMRRRTNRG